MDTRWNMVLVLALVFAGCATALAATVPPEEASAFAEPPALRAFGSYDCPQNACSIVYRTDRADGTSTVVVVDP